MLRSNACIVCEGGLKQGHFLRRAATNMLHARMSCAVALLLATVLLVTPDRLPAAVQPFPQMTERVLDQYVLRRFDKLKQATDKLATGVAKLCDGKKRRKSAVREQFDEAVLAW